MRPTKEKTIPCDLSIKVQVVAVDDQISSVNLTYLKKKGLVCETSGCSTALQEKILAWLEAYVQRKPLKLALPLQLQKGGFASHVLKEISKIPFGKQRSYKELATNAGSPNGARAAGNACGANPFPLFIPCHRVVKSDGTLGGFSSDFRIKEQLLEFELRSR